MVRTLTALTFGVGLGMCSAYRVEEVKSENEELKECPKTLSDSPCPPKTYFCRANRGCMASNQDPCKVPLCEPPTKKGRPKKGPKTEADFSECLWSKKFDADYKNPRPVGKGATACVYLAEDSTGTTVAVKVGKATSSLASWEAECKEMQLTRVKACKSTEDKKDRKMLYKLNQQFIPTCLEVGSIPEEDINYYIMHAAGTKIIGDVGDDEYTIDQRKNLFAQLVGAVYALHGIDTSHNDLHGGNIVIDDNNGKLDLSLIDFGDIVSPLDPSSVKHGRTTHLDGYKRDGNAVWMYASVLVDCPSFSSTSEMSRASQKELKEKKDEFLECMKKIWGAGSKDIAAMRVVIENDIAKDPDQAIKGLFNTKLVQDNLPKFKRTYPWERTMGCDAWPVKKITSLKRELTYKSLYRCDTVPTYVETFTDRGTGKAMQRKQCPRMKSACFSTTKGDTWACNAALIKDSPCSDVKLSSGKYYNGGCVTPENKEAYPYAADWTR